MAHQDATPINPDADIDFLISAFFLVLFVVLPGTILLASLVWTAAYRMKKRTDLPIKKGTGSSKK